MRGKKNPKTIYGVMCIDSKLYSFPIKECCWDDFRELDDYKPRETVVDSELLEVLEWFESEYKKIFPSHTKPKRNITAAEKALKWANNKGYSIERIKEIILYAFNDDFWKDKLRTFQSIQANRGNGSRLEILDRRLTADNPKPQDIEEEIPMID